MQETGSVCGRSRAGRGCQGAIETQVSKGGRARPQGIWMLSGVKAAVLSRGPDQALPPSCPETLDKLFSLSVPQFPHPYNGGKIIVPMASCADGEMRALPGIKHTFNEC